MSEVTASSQNTSVQSAAKRGKRSGARNRHHVSAGAKQNKGQETLLRGVEALVKAHHDEVVVVSGVTLRIHDDKHEKRAYHLMEAVPGSAIAVSGEKTAMIQERFLIMKECPPEARIGFGGVLLWDHLVQNGIRKALGVAE